jgi:hypothetical protein
MPCKLLEDLLKAFEGFLKAFRRLFEGILKIF